MFSLLPQRLCLQVTHFCSSTLNLHDQIQNKAPPIKGGINKHNLNRHGLQNSG